MGFLPDYNPGEAYSRSEVVDELHGFYHHNNADQFSTDKESDYVTAIVILGAAPLMFAVVLLLVYFILLFYRCCKSSCAAKEAFCGPVCSRFLLGFPRAFTSLTLHMVELRAGGACLRSLDKPSVGTPQTIFGG